VDEWVSGGEKEIWEMKEREFSYWPRAGFRWIEVSITLSRLEVL
jgi:hypothetical protein